MPTQHDRHSKTPRMTDERRPASQIRCEALTIEFPGGVRAIDQVDLVAPAGRILALIGPSGCGKTTLLRAIAGLQPVSSGAITLDPQATSQSGAIGFVFQQPALLPWRSALENVLLPLELSGDARKNRRSIGDQLLSAVELADVATRFPGQLSGGMRMRVSIARALVTAPSVLLLDEPFAALDDMLRNQLGGLLRELWQARGFTAVMVTHNIGEAVLLSHQIAVMRDGRVDAPISNPLPEPRDQELRRTPEFAAFYGQVSDALRGHG